MTNDTYHVKEGAIFREINNIVGRISRRRPPEPTPTERARLLKLRSQLTALRRGEDIHERDDAS